MKLEDLQPGETYWCIRPSIETEAYNSDAVAPWQGKYHLSNNGAMQLSRFDAETGVFDDDSNATALVMPRQLYETQDVAMRAYTARLICELKDQLMDIEQKTDQLFALFEQMEKEV